MVTQEEALRLIRVGYDLARFQTHTKEEIESIFSEVVAAQIIPTHSTGKESGVGVANATSSSIHANFEQMGGKLVALGSQAGKSDSS